tara:strand:- start:1349 stop:1522 length:174 start_codon:yes stop_codon:yes gene_type:complete
MAGGIAVDEWMSGGIAVDEWPVAPASGNETARREASPRPAQRNSPVFIGYIAGTGGN